MRRAFMNNYTYDINIAWLGAYLGANSKKELVESIKEIWFEEYNITLKDDEISNIEEDKCE